MNKENLKKARKKMGFTQKEIADKIGVGISTYKNYECGIREPNNEKIVMLANLLKVSTDYLLGNEDSEKKYFEINKVKDVSSSIKSIEGKVDISLKELKVIESYRIHKDMQAAIDRILEIEED